MDFYIQFRLIFQGIRDVFRVRSLSFILEYADLVRYICKGYSMASFQIRNEWMVGHSNRVIAVFNGESGGTKNTIDYAKDKNIEITQL